MQNINLNMNMSRQMAAAGFKLHSKDEPGIYVRDEKSPHKNAIDWHSMPTELIAKVNREIDLYLEEVTGGPVSDEAKFKLMYPGRVDTRVNLEKGRG